MKHSIVYVTSHPMSLMAFLLPHIRATSAVYDVRAMANINDSMLLKQSGLDVMVDSVPLTRPITPWFDIAALWVLYWSFKSTRPSIVHTITPKAGLLGMFAAWLARVPIRIHSFTGQVWVTRRGFMRWLLMAADKCTAALATDLLVDSHSQRIFLIQQGVIKGARSAVLGSGSICGVNTDRFYPNNISKGVVRKQLGTSLDTFVCLYLGRLNRDKGVLDLAQAFAAVVKKHRNTELWVVGPDETDYYEQMRSLMKDILPQVKRVGFTSESEQFMQAADLFCLPSYREGFGSSVIEAAACGTPSLVSRIYGLTDAVVEGETGWMHRPGDVDDLTKNLDEIISDKSELKIRANKAFKRVNQKFKQDQIVSEMLIFYRDKLKDV